MYMKKLETFKNYPYKGLLVINKILLPLSIMANYLNNRLAKYKLKDLIPLLNNRPPDAFTPEHSGWGDLYLLYKLIKKRRPQTVFEFGSGNSTIIIAQALKENGTGYLYSFDYSKYWKDATVKSIPDGLREYCEVKHTPIIETKYNGVKAWRHSGLPQVSPDFLYLDSPWLTPKRQVAVDPLDLEWKFRKGFFMLVDGRTINVFFLKKYLRKKYKFRYRRLFSNSTFELK